MRTDLKKILIRAPNWLGDAVMAEPTIRDIRLHLPCAEISLLAPDGVSELLARDPAIDVFLPFSRTKEKKQSEIARIDAYLQESAYDLAILMTGSFSTAWQMAKAHIPIRIGFSGHWRRPFLTHPVQPPQEREHLVTTYRRLLAPIGIPSCSASPELFLSSGEKEHARGFLEAHGVDKEDRLIGINPGAAYGAAKCWPPENFQKLTAKLLDDEKVRIIYFGDNASKQLVDAICSKFNERVINCSGGTTLREAMALINCCDHFITNDSGPMHIRAAFGKPLLAIFGSTDIIKTGPYDTGRVISKDSPCGPCCLRRCPIDFRCMRQLSPEEVYYTYMEQE
jgi:heptosyltransferase-2